VWTTLLPTARTLQPPANTWAIAAPLIVAMHPGTHIANHTVTRTATRTVTRTASRRATAIAVVVAATLPAAVATIAKGSVTLMEEIVATGGRGAARPLQEAAVEGTVLLQAPGAGAVTAGARPVAVAAAPRSPDPARRTMPGTPLSHLRRLRPMEGGEPS